MCQPKSKGGKRCLRHAKLSQFVSKFVSHKTGASEEFVYDTLSELNREGKALNLPAVSGAEVAGLIQKQELAMDVTRNLNSHDRKMLDKKLQGSKEETKNGVDGSHFYAWKNLLTRVRSKLRTAVLSIGIVGSLAIGISGCSAGVTPAPSETLSPTISASATPTATQPAEAVKYGDVVGTGKIVKDDHGTYETTKLDSGDDALKYNKNIVDKTASSRFKQGDITDAQAFVADFTATQGMDSTAADGGAATWNAWKKNVAPAYVLSSSLDQLTADKVNGTDSTLIINDLSKNQPIFLRDGKPRISKEDLKIAKVTGGSDSTVGEYLTFQGEDTAVYRLSNAEARAALKKSNPGKSEAELAKAFPDTFSGKSTPQQQETLSFSYSVVKSPTGWKLVGYQNTVSGQTINLK